MKLFLMTVCILVGIGITGVCTEEDTLTLFDLYNVYDVVDSIMANNYIPKYILDNPTLLRSSIVPQVVGHALSSLQLQLADDDLVLIHATVELYIKRKLN